MISPVSRTSSDAARGVGAKRRPRRLSGPLSGRRVLRAAFTLVELLLVMAIIGVVTAVVVPSFVRSIRGNRMRVATRTVVMAGRYARSMALLRQASMILRFDLDAGRVSVAQAAPVKEDETEPGAPEGADELPEAVAPAGNDALLEPRPARHGDAELARSLDRVMIESVEIETEDLLAAEGDIAVWYENNGRCTPYVVTLVDEEGATVEIEVDAFSTPTTTALQ